MINWFFVRLWVEKTTEIFEGTLRQGGISLAAIYLKKMRTKVEKIAAHWLPFDLTLSALKDG